MESGGSNLLLPPGKLVRCMHKQHPHILKLESQDHSSVKSRHITPGDAWGYMVKPHGQLVLVSFTHY